MKHIKLFENFEAKYKKVSLRDGEKYYKDHKIENFNNDEISNIKNSTKYHVTSYNNSVKLLKNSTIINIKKLNNDTYYVKHNIKRENTFTKCYICSGINGLIEYIKTL